MKWNQNDAGRSTSLRPKQSLDCVIRAIALASQKPYDEVYDLMASAGRKSGRSTPKKVWKEVIHPMGLHYSFPAEKGLPRTTLADFAATFNSGRWVVQLAGHLTAVVNGEVLDTECPRSNACVYGAWKFS